MIICRFKKALTQVDNNHLSISYQLYVCDTENIHLIYDVLRCGCRCNQGRREVVEGPGNVSKYGYGQLLKVTKKLQLYDSGSTLF